MFTAILVLEIVALVATSAARELKKKK